MYKNYIFDLYGTLIDINTNEWKVSLWKNMAMIYSMSGAKYTWRELKNRYEQLVQEEIKKIPPEKYTTTPEPQILFVFKQLFSEKGVEVSDELAEYTGRVFRSLSIKYIKLYDGVDELLGAIRAHGGKIYLLSNAQRIFTEPEIRMLDLWDKFDDVLISSDDGSAKPDIMFFRKILERHDLDPKECVMIGNDYRTDIDGAYNAGIDSLYLHTNISPEINGEMHAKYVIMSGSLFEARDALFGKE